MRPLTLRQIDRLWRILEPSYGRFASTKAEIAGYQQLVDRDLVRWVDQVGSATTCRIPQILPDGIRAIADFYATGRFTELGTLKPEPGGPRLMMQLTAAYLDPNTAPPPRLAPALNASSSTGAHRS